MSDLLMNRRGFLQSCLALGAAPAIVRADSLMRVVARNTTIIDVDVAGPGWERAFVTFVHPDAELDFRMRTGANLLKEELTYFERPLLIRVGPYSPEELARVRR